jgi:hypothetical protein
MKTQHAQFILSDSTWPSKHHLLYHRSDEAMKEIEDESFSSDDKQPSSNDDLVLVV